MIQFPGKKFAKYNIDTSGLSTSEEFGKQEIQDGKDRYYNQSFLPTNKTD